MRNLEVVAGSIVAVLLATASDAATLVYTATLNSAAENNPANTSPGTGTATVTLDTVLQTLQVNASFGGLQGTSTAAHLHCCSLPSGNAGVAVGSPILPGFPLGVPQGSYSQSLDLTQVALYGAQFVANNGGTVDGAYAAFVAGLDGGLAYFNIHSNLFSAGEIRGQLTAVPLPTTLPLVLTAVAALGLRAGRLRRR